ncbi:MAG: ATP-binding protein [Gemmatimonadota bacterium]
MTPSVADCTTSPDETLEARLRHVEKMDAVARLAGGLAQDVGNLLTAAGGNVRELLAECDQDHPMVERLDDLRESIRRAASITHQLNTFARRQPRRPALVELNALVAQVRPLVTRLAGPFVTIEEVAAEGGVWIEADAGQLEQMLLTLVANARDAMPLGGKLRVGTFRWHVGSERPHRHGVLRAGNWAVLEVRDSGAGMEPDVLEHLFEPFFTTKDPGQGTGLGLAAVYGLARQLGGQVIVESAPDAGSTFAVCIPAKEAPQGRATAAVGPDAVLVVDDDEWVRTVTARILRRAGYGVLQADHAAAAIELLRDVAGGCVRVVLTDLLMAGESGRALADVVRRDYPGVRLVLMSGLRADLVPPTLSQVGDGPVLTKPFTAAELLQAVRAPGP